MWAFVMALFSFFSQFSVTIKNFVLEHLHLVLAWFSSFSIPIKETFVLHIVLALLTFFSFQIHNHHVMAWFRFLSATIKNFVLDHSFSIPIKEIFVLHNLYLVVLPFLTFFSFQIKNFVLDHLHLATPWFRFLSGPIKIIVLNHLYLVVLSLTALFTFFSFQIMNFLWDHVHNILLVGSNVKALNREFDILKKKLMYVEKEIEKDEASMKKPTEEVEGWMQRVEALQPSVESVVTAYVNQSYLCSIYSIGIRAVNKLKEVRQEAEIIKSVRAYTTAAPPPSVQWISFTLPIEFGQEMFESRLQEALNFLGDDNQGVLGIWGMGGVGKTTLLEHINNTLENNSLLFGFDKVVLVTSSKESTPEKIQTELANKLGMPTGGDDRTHIFNYLRTKSFAILLDDVWGHQDLEEVGVPLPLGVVGEHKLKRKLILTSRSHHVCSMMGARQTIKVDCLSTEDARLLFRDNAGIDAIIIRYNPLTGELADEVADECAGLPIALITTGQALAGNQIVQVWENALQLLRNSKLSQIPGMDDPLPLLKVSYDHLKDPMEKECLLHCALWPEAHNIPKDDLIQCWIGHGLLGKFDSIQKAYNTGHAIINNLLKVCLLENVKVLNEFTLKNERVKLHGIIRDMALWIARGCNVENDRKWVVLHGNQVKAAQTWSEAHKMSFMFTDISSWPSEIQNCPNLTTLILHYNWQLNSMSILKHLHVLKYLDLSFCWVLDEFPIEICLLDKLEYLNLSHTLVSSLPEELKNLTNLKYLLLQDTSISTVPAKLLSNMVSLMELDLFHSEGFVSQSSIIDHLNCLEGHLHALGISASSLLDFKKLIQLSGISIRALCIRKMEDLASPSLGLLSPELLGSQNICSSLKTLTIAGLDESLEELVMEEKCCLMTLDSLTIEGAEGLKEIIWRGVEPMEVFPNLRDMFIENCDHMRHVTWIANLPCLERLKLEMCDNMEQLLVWEGAVVEESSRHIFPSLRILDLNNLKKLISICDHALTFPSLEYLHMFYCPQLMKLPFQSPASCYNLKKIQAEKEWWKYIVELEGDMRAFLDPLFKAW